MRGAGDTTTTIDGESTAGLAAGTATSAPENTAPAGPRLESTFKSRGCLGYPALRTPTRGWYPPQGGNTEGLKGSQKAQRSQTLDRLSRAVDDQLPEPYAKESTAEVRQDKCVLRRTVVLRDPGTGAGFGVTWEQLKDTRARDSVTHTGPLAWQSRTDGGALATDSADPSVRAVLLVVGDGRSVYVVSTGRRSNHLGGYPNTTTAKGPVDPAPFSIDQLRVIAERLIAVSQA